MNQWNRLKVQIIKTRRVKCDSLELPSSLKSPEVSPQSKEKSHRSSTNSAQTFSWESSGGNCGYNYSQTSGAAVGDTSFDMEDDIFSSPLKTEIEVFDEFGEAGEDFSKHKRWFSLPGCLNSETMDDTNNNGRHPHGLYIKDDSRTETSERNFVTEETGSISGDSEGCWTRFPHSTDIGVCANEIYNTMNSSRIPHAVKMSDQDKRVAGKLNTDNNNNKLPKPGEFTSSQSQTDLKRDNWDTKVLEFTSETVFGAELCVKRDQEGTSRSRSVTLTGSVYEVVKLQDQKAREFEGRVKSESKQDMPKFQNVLWDYVKRRSSKTRGPRVSEGDTESHLGGLKGDEGDRRTYELNQCYATKSPEVNEKCSENVEQTRDSNVDSLTRHKLHLEKSMSTSNMTSSRQETGSIKGAGTGTRRAHPRARSCSWDEAQAQSQTKISLEEFKDNPEILKLLLTTDPERRPMEERLKTLTFSREWLLKELKALREDDRRLARQFINLRSAIQEIKKAREKEELDYYDSEGEGCKAKLIAIGSKRLGLVKEGNGNDTEYQLHVTPTRNILNYC